jgi:ribosomal protein L37E
MATVESCKRCGESLWRILDDKLQCLGCGFKRSATKEEIAFFKK